MIKRWDGRILCLMLAIGAAGVLAAPARAIHTAETSVESRFFEQTGHSLRRGFHSFWETRGDLAIFGYPITREVQQKGRTTTQYFKPARFEYHLEQQGTPYAVQLGYLGAQYAQASALPSDVTARAHASQPSRSTTDPPPKARLV